MVLVIVKYEIKRPSFISILPIYPIADVTQIHRNDSSELFR